MPLNLVLILGLVAIGVYRQKARSKHLDSKVNDLNCTGKVIKVKPPFTNLPFFNVNAITLSYIVYMDNVELFLKRLSKNANQYYLNHEKILREFLKETPKITRTLDFGLNMRPWYHEYPTED